MTVSLSLPTIRNTMRITLGITEGLARVSAQERKGGGQWGHLYQQGQCWNAVENGNVVSGAMLGFVPRSCRCCYC